MKRFAYRCRDSIVALVRVLLYIALLFVLFGLLSINNSWVLAISRTAAIMLLTFLFGSVAMSKIYGKYDVGKRKSKPIILSLSLSIVITDIITFMMMVVMNTNNTTDNSLYPYFGVDILWVLLAMVIQIIVIILFAYAGNAIYFSFTDPEKSLLVIAKEGDRPNFMHGVERYKKQYRVEKIVTIDDPSLKEEVCAADTIFIGDLPDLELDGLLLYCYSRHKNIYRIMDINGVMTRFSNVVVMHDEAMLASRVNSMTMGQRILKRLGDIFISGVGLILTSPLLLIAAIAIKLEDRGKVIFKQNRVTINGRIFNIYKLRTMKEHSDQRMTVAGDDRVTKVGRVLRKFRIDELPQFVNVLKGEMSLVGPRAEMLEHEYLYSEELPEFIYRHRMKAGLTGYAQIHGRYNTSPRDKLMMDLVYIESFSIWNDLRILFQTVMVFFTADDSTEGFSADTEEKHREQAKKIQAKVRHTDEQQS